MTTEIELTVIEKLENLNACSDAIEWAQDKTFKEIWSTCERGDWLLWLIHKADLCDLQLKTLIKVECAELAVHLMQDERSKNALKVARRFTEGKATREELNAAAAAAYAAAAAAADNAYAAADNAYDADADAAAAAAAAYAAAAAAAYAAYADAAAAAAYAADAAAAYAADARQKTLKQCAGIVRKHLPNPKL